MINDIFNIVRGSTVRNNPPWISRHDGIFRDIEVDVRTGSDHYVIADSNTSNHDRVCADPDAVANHRDTLPAPAIALTDHYSGREVYVTTNPAHGVECQMPEVTNVESGADLGFYLNVKAIVVAVMLEQKSIQKGACNSQPARAKLSRLTLAQEVTEPEAGDFAKCSPERGAVVASVVAPEIGADCRFEVHRQGNSPGFISRRIVSRTGSLLERQNEIAKISLVPGFDGNRQ